jgi:uncharacterized protein (DUF849 family)
MTKDFFFRNTFADVEKLVELLGAGGTRFEFECYDIGHIYNLATSLTAHRRAAALRPGA